MPSALLVLLFPTTALAFPTGPEPAAVVDPARQQEVRDSLFGSFEQAFSPEAPIDGRPGCQTMLLRELARHEALFTAEQRAAIDARIFKPTPRPLPPPQPAATSSCFGQQGAYQIVSAHFSVEYDDTDLADDAQDFSDSLEYAWQMEVEEQGWNAPLSSDDYLMLAIVSSERFNGAYTTVERCGGDYVPYMVASYESFSWRQWAEEMAAHEFNHTLQFSTSYAPDGFWWEATATYMEDNVYPTYNGWSDYVTGYTTYPYLGLNAYSDRDQDIFYHMYGMAIFGFQLDDHLAGIDAVRDTWDYASRSNNYYGLSIERMVEFGLDTPWFDVYKDFLANVTVMDFEDSRYMPDLRLQETVDALPYTGSPTSSEEPQPNGQHFTVFESDLGDAGAPLHVTFDGDDGPEWVALLVATQGNEIMEVVDLLPDEAGVAEGYIAFQGGPVYFVASPWDSDAVGYDYNWDRAPTSSFVLNADNTTVPEDTAVLDTGADDTGIDDPPGKKPVSGGVCGCASGAPAGGGLGLMGLALALSARRRRR